MTPEAGVVAFDDVVARIREAYVVSLVADHQRLLLANEFAARPIADRNPAPVARAIGVALDDYVA